MSIVGMAHTEVERNTRAPTDKAGSTDKPRSQALVDAIPGEVLAPYTAILAVIVANSDRGEWELGRWVLYIVAGLLVPTAVWYLWDRDSPEGEKKRKVPVAGMVGSTLAFAAWGLVMPGAPLTFEVTDQQELTIWTFIIVTVAAGVIALLPLTRPTNKT